jgi:hypothetical protein
MGARLAQTGDLLADAVVLEQALPRGSVSTAAKPTRVPATAAAKRPRSVATRPTKTATTKRK